MRGPADPLLALSFFLCILGHPNLQVSLRPIGAPSGGLRAVGFVLG